MTLLSQSKQWLNKDHLWTFCENIEVCTFVLFSVSHVTSWVLGLDVPLKVDQGPQQCQLRRFGLCWVMRLGDAGDASTLRIWAPNVGVDASVLCDALDSVEETDTCHFAKIFMPCKFCKFASFAPFAWCVFYGLGGWQHHFQRVVVQWQRADWSKKFLFRTEKGKLYVANMHLQSCI